MKAWREHTVRQLFHKTKTRVINLSAAALLAISSTAGAFPLLVSNHASALPLGQTQLGLSSGAPSNIEAGVGTASFSVKDRLGLGGNNWTNILTGSSSAAITATVTNGEVAANCDANWLTSATVTVPAGGKVVEATFCYRSNTVGTHSVQLSESVPYALLHTTLTDTATVPVTVVDTTAPSVPVNGHPSSGYLTSNVFDYVWDASTDNSDSPIHYEWQGSNASCATNANGSLASVTWNSAANGSAAQLAALNAGPNVPSLGTSDGTWCWQVRAIDATGNASAWSQVWNFTLDSQAPAIPVLVSPANNTYTKGGSITQSWSDTSTDVDHYIYESYNDAAATSLRWHEEFSGATTSKTATNVADAVYYWRVKAVDAAGNESPWSNLWKITVDNDAPTLTPKSAPDSVGVDPVFSKVSFKLHDTVAGFTYQINGGALHSLSANTWSDINNISIGHNGGVAGDNTITVWDLAGNSVTRHFTLDNTGPTIAVKNAPYTVGSAADKLFSKVGFSLYDACEVEGFALNGGAEHHVTPNKWSDANDIWVNHFGGVAGTNTITAYDMCGNTSSYTFTLDSTAPTITVKPAPDTVGSTADKVFSKVSFKLFDAHKIDKVTINGVTKDLSNNQWSDVNGVKPGVYGAIAGTNTIVAYDVAGNTTTYTFTLDTTSPTVTIKTTSTGYTPVSAPDNATANEYTLVNFKLFDANKVDKFVINGHTVNLSDNKWSDANGFSVGNMFGKLGDNTLVVYDVAGNTTTTTFKLAQPGSGSGSTDNSGSSSTTSTSTAVQPQTTAFATTNAVAAPTDDGDNSTNSEVLGASTDSNKDNGGNVKGTATTATDVKDVKDSRFLGLGWWWLAILALVAALWLVFMRRRSEEQ